ncbi:MAG: hypothetical protein NTU57_02455 [Candidatus Aenigmarchaeota archaeon]|nr:hypothetical protein [Candidatus Aenigmarchaeota archaeon]
MEPRLLMLYKPLTASHEYIEKKLLDLLRQEGRIISTRTWDASPDELMKELYAVHKDRPFFDSLWNLYSGKRLVTNVFEAGEDHKNPAKWIEHMRDDVIGYKDPIKAKPGSFRSFVYEVTGDSIERVNRENRPMDNGVHLSDSVETGIREGGIFFWDYILNPQIKKLFSNLEQALKEGSTAMKLVKRGEGIFFEERLLNALLKEKQIKPQELDSITSITENKGVLSISLGYDDENDNGNTIIAE